ncbi:MAG: sugar ABC transporter permease [Fibrobacterota bacterium]
MNGIRDVFFKYKTEALMLLPVFLYLTGFLVMIFYYLLSLSLTYVAPDFTVTFPSLTNYHALFANRDFLVALLHTLVFVIVGTPLELAAGLVLAMLVYRNFPMRGIVRSIFIIPLAVPAMVTAIILLQLFEYPGGHINTLLMGKHAVMPAIMEMPVNWRDSAASSLGISLIGKVWRDMPISMLILLAGLNAITQDQYAAAETMGANERQKFRFITLPLLLPAISTVLIIRSIEMWKEFIFPYFLARRYHLLGTLIEYLYHDWNKKGEAAAVSVILVACIVCSAVLLFWVLRTVRVRLVRV